jgi:hypothetical protein
LPQDTHIEVTQDRVSDQVMELGSKGFELTVIVVQLNNRLEPLFIVVHVSVVDHVWFTVQPTNQIGAEAVMNDPEDMLAFHALSRRFILNP